MRLREILCALALGACATTAGADPVDLKPFSATYAIEWKGIRAGTSTLELRRSGEDAFQYSTSNVPRGMFRLALPDAITQSSRFRIVDGRVVPFEYQGTDEKERPINLKFDWTAKRVTGVAKGDPVDLPLTDGTQDPMSLQIASLRKLQAGTLQETVTLIDSDTIKEYEVRQEGSAQIDTGLGRLDTVIFTSQRAGSDRITRTWVAPVLGYLPVKAERIRKNKVEFTMMIESTTQ